MSRKHIARSFVVVSLMLCGVGLALGQVSSSTAVVAAPEFTQVRQETFDKVWNTINEKHFDPTFGGVDWKKVRETYLPKAQAAKTDEDFHNVLRRMLAELKLSHFNVFPPQPVVGTADSTASVGLHVIWLEDRPMVASVEKGSSAEKAGIKAGWIIKGVDGKPLAEMLKPLLEYLAKLPMADGMRRLSIERSIENLMSGKADTSVAVEFLDAADQSKKADLVRVAFKGEMSPAVGNFPGQKLIFESCMLDGNIGYIRFNMWTIPQLPKIRAAIKEFAKADGIIFDVRGNPGGIGGLAAGTAGLISDKQISLGTLTARSGTMALVGYPQSEPYLGKIVVLTDHGSASTSEMFAAGIQESGRGKIVGETTAGAILASVFDVLPTGWRFQYAISDYKSPNNILIEGRGVVPNVKVLPTRKDLLEGRDTQLEAAINQISEIKK